jgi:hypothetical protein
MGLYGRWQRWRSEVLRAIGQALGECGICAWQTSIVGKDDDACEEYWREK